MNLEELKQLLQILEEKQIADFEIEESGVKLRIRKAAAPASPAAAVPGPPAPVVAPAVAPAVPGPVAAVEAAPTAEPAVEDGLQIVNSPIVGTFYRAPDPNSPPFVSTGDQVKLGQVLCIIEAMKLMNEIEAEVAGEVVRIHVDSGQPVQYGDPLFTIRPAR